MRRNEIKAWMELYKLSMQAAIGLVLAILLQGLLGNLQATKASLVFAASLLSILPFLTLKYIRLAKQIDDLEGVE